MIPAALVFSRSLRGDFGSVAEFMSDRRHSTGFDAVIRWPGGATCAGALWRAAHPCG
jgi:hypothetical protein